MKLSSLFFASIIFSVFAIVGTDLHASSLSDMQEQAVANRKIVLQQQANLAKSVEDIEIARSNYYPSFDLSYSMNKLKEKTLFENDETSIFRGTLTWNIFAGFRDQYSLQSSQFLKQAEQLKETGLKQDIYLSIALRYLAIYNNKSNFRVATDTHKTIKKLYTDAESRYQVGLIQKSDLLKFKVDLDNALIDLKQSEAEVNKSIKRLERELDATVQYELFDFNEFNAIPPLPDYEKSKTVMLTNRSDIKILEELIAASKSQELIAKSDRYPRVDLTSSYRKNNSSLVLTNQAEYDEEFRTQLVVSINLFDGFGKYARVKKAKYNTDSLRYQLFELEDELSTELNLLFLDYQVNLENVSVAQRSILQAQENLRVTKLSYEEGLSPESDLLDSITNLSRARSNYVAAKSRAFDNYFRISRAMESFEVLSSPQM